MRVVCYTMVVADRLVCAFDVICVVGGAVVVVVVVVAIGVAGFGVMVCVCVLFLLSMMGFAGVVVVLLSLSLPSWFLSWRLFLSVLLVSVVFSLGLVLIFLLY